MNTITLENYGLVEMNQSEMIELEGGIIPVLILVGWGIMAACSCVAVGMYHAGKDAKVLN